MSYFCIMKRNIWLFKTFFVSFALLLTCLDTISAEEQHDSILSDRFGQMEVSLLTCEPHDEVYSLYGHTAVRIEDKATGHDWAVNWGVFDSRESFFVLRFIFGLTDYTVAVYDFQDFLAEYRNYGCAVHQQRINMNAEQKRRFMMLLEENLEPQNAVYRYNYYYNNCTTKARDIIFHAVQTGPEFIQWPDHDEEESHITFRDLIHGKNADHPWARWGNDILLGVGSDQPTRNDEREFLPDMLMRDFEEARICVSSDHKTVENFPLVDSTFVVLPAGVPYHADGFDVPFTPTHCAIAFVCAILALITYERKTHKRAPWAEFAACSVYGIVGIFLFLMLFSQHPTVRANLQILICNPLMFYLTFPKTRMKHRWEVVLMLCLLFFAGNAIQSYAEGMNLMALALSLLAVNSILYKKL